MQDTLTSWFKVSIDFKQSHLFFPTIIVWILLILGGAILIVYGIPFVRDVKSGKRKKTAMFVENFDHLRFWGTLALMIFYVMAMKHVGELFPNMGFGFLFATIPFMFVLSLLYVHEIDRRKIALITINSLLVPGISWYVLGNLFNLSLP